MDQNISKPLCVSPEKNGVKAISHLRVLVVSPMFGGNIHIKSPCIVLTKFPNFAK
jgi:hypothetical protein